MCFSRSPLAWHQLLRRSEASSPLAAQLSAIARLDLSKSKAKAREKTSFAVSSQWNTERNIVNLIKDTDHQTHSCPLSTCNVGKVDQEDRDQIKPKCVYLTLYGSQCVNMCQPFQDSKERPKSILIFDAAFPARSCLQGIREGQLKSWQEDTRSSLCERKRASALRGRSHGGRGRSHSHCAAGRCHREHSLPFSEHISCDKELMEFLPGAHPRAKDLRHGPDEEDWSPCIKTVKDWV